MAEEILIGVRLDRQEGEKEIDSLTQSIVELNKANKELTEANKTLAKTGQDNTKEYKDNARQIEINKQKITENTASRKGLVQAIVAEEGSLKQLRIENQMLIKQRDSINIKTDEGKKKIQELNAQIDKNNDVIKENSSKLEQQKLNIGNYAGAIDKLIPGFANLQSALTSAITGIKSATTAYQGLTLAQRAFLGPLLLIIAALALVFSFFTRTEAGADKLAKVMAQLGAIVDVLADRAALLGKALVSLFTGDLIGAANAATEAVSGLGDELQREVEEAGKLADILDELEDRERSYAVAASITTLEIKRLIVQAKNRNLTEQERIDLLDKATALELKSNKELLKLREDDLDAAIRAVKQTTEGAKMEQKLNETRLEFATRIIENAEIQGAEKDKLAEKIKAYNEAEGQSLVLQEALQNKRDALAEKRDAQAAKEREDAIKRADEHSEEILRLELLAIAEENARIARNERLDADLLADLNRINQKQAADEAYFNKLTDHHEQEEKEESKLSANEEKRLKSALFWYQNKDKLIMDSAVALSSGLQAIAEKDSAFSKTVALVQVGINSAIGVARAVAAGAGLIFPANIFAIASGVAAVLTGIGQAKSLLGFIKGGLIPGFATGGGISGTRIMSGHGVPINRSNGDNRLITAKIGETVVTEHQKQLLGGDRAFAEAGIPGFARGGQIGGGTSIARGISLSEINAIVTATMQNMPPIQVAVEDINKGQAARAQVVEISTLR